MPPGATGKFPQGRLSPDDEGELVVEVHYDAATGLVRVDNGKPVEWMAMSPQAAMEFVRALITACAEAPETQ